MEQTIVVAQSFAYIVYSLWYVQISPNDAIDFLLFCCA